MQEFERTRHAINPTPNVLTDINLFHQKNDGKLYDNSYYRFFEDDERPLK
jgi:hypothetical protein